MIQDRDKVRRTLDCLSDWSPKQLEEEFSQWEPQRITKLWNLLEESFRNMCRGWGLANRRQQLSQRGIYTQRQIQRLAVLQRFADRGVN